MFLRLVDERAVVATVMCGPETWGMKVLVGSKLVLLKLSLREVTRMEKFRNKEVSETELMSL